MIAVTTSTPAPARLLGFGGLLPFVTLAAASAFDPSHAAFWRHALVAYGAVILSFVGALHWGFATVWESHSAHYRSRLMGWSVVPALGAWIALLAPSQIGLALLTLLFAVHYVFDLGLARRSNLPGWYMRLRTPLTAGAVLSLAFALFAA